MNFKQAEYFLLDVFTASRYGGNQLAIFPDARFIDENLFQSIARELNLSETVFLFPSEGPEDYSMRIFTPGKELPTAGHPTVGTGFYLARELNHISDGVKKITLKQKIGLIDVFVEFKNNLPDMVTMHQPLPIFGPTHNDKRKELASALSLSIHDLDDAPVQEVSCGNNTLLIPLKSARTLSKVTVKTDAWAALKKVCGDAFLYVFSTQEVMGGDVQGRMFAPEIGIPEDPATGSANGPLACYLTKYKLINLPAISLQGYEMGRPSQLFLDTTVSENGEICQVKVGGKSVFVGKAFHFLD